MAKDRDNDIDDLMEIVRVGIVMKVKKSDRTAIVKFEDLDDLKSDWLPILYHREKCPSTCISNCGGFKEPWLPDVGDTVLCLYMPNSDGDGFILGRI